MEEHEFHSPVDIEDLRPGDHLCCIYETEEEHRAVLTPFLCLGLERNERIVYVVDTRTAEAVLAYLRDIGLDTEGYLKSGQLEVLARDDTYMHAGTFDPDAMIAWLRSETKRALADGYSALRVTGEMTWALHGLPGSQRLIEYEARLKGFFPGSRCLAFCQYDRRRFAPNVLLDVLRTHPIVVLNAEVHDNSHYNATDDLMSPEAAASTLHQWLDQLRQHRRHQQALLESQWRANFLADLLDSSAQPFAIGYPDGRLAQPNKSFLDLVGYTREETASLDWARDLTPPEWLEYEKTRLEELLRTAEPVRYEKEYIRKDGTRVPVELLVHLARDEKGEPGYCYAFVADVTERKHAEHALHTMAEQWQTAFDAVADMIWLLDRDGRIVRCNRTTPDILKTHASQIVSRHCWEVVHGTGEPIKECPVLRMRETLKRESLELRIGDRWCQITVDPILDADGRLAGAVHVTSDISERKRAEESLRESEEKYRTVANFTYDWELWMSPEGKLLYTSPSCERITGYSADEYLADPELLKAIVHPDDWDAWERHPPKGSPSEVHLVVVRIMTKGGEERLIEHTCRPVFGQDGRYLGRRGSNRDVTDRMRMEESIRKSEETFSKAFHASPAAVGIHRMSDSRLVEVNEALEKLTGYHREEIIGRTAVELGLWVDLKEREHALQLLNAEGRVQDLECRFRTKDGGVIICRYSSVIIELAGEICGLVTLVDITERKRMEDALRESEQRFQLAMDAADEGLWDWNLSTGRVIRNDRFYTMLGYQPGEISESFDSWADLLHPDDRERAIQVLREYVQGGGTDYEVEFRTKAADGEWKWILSRGRIAERDVNGRPTRMLGTHVDITDRKQAEEQLRLEKERVQQYLDIADVMILALDTNADVMLVNRKGCELLGCEEGDILGKNWFIHFLPEKDRDQIRKSFFDMIAGNEEVHTYHENHVLTRSGGERLIAWRNAVIRDESGKIMGALSSGEDITIARHSEEILRDRAEMLRQAEETAHIGSWMRDLRTNKLTWSDEVYRIFGMEPQDFPGTYEAFLEAVHPDDRPAVAAAYSESLGEGRSCYEIEHRIVRKRTGDIRHVHEKCAFVRDDSGRVIRAVGMVQDITEHKRLENEREALGRLATRLAGCSDIRGMISAVEDEAGQLLAWDSWFFAVRDLESDAFNVLYFIDTVEGERKEYPSESWPISKLSQPLRPLLDGKPVVLNRTQGEAKPLLQPFGNTSRQSASLVFAPVRGEKAVIGILSAQSYDRHRYSQNHALLLQRIADLLAPALDRVLATDALRESET